MNFSDSLLFRAFTSGKATAADLSAVMLFHNRLSIALAHE